MAEKRTVKKSRMKKKAAKGMAGVKARVQKALRTQPKTTKKRGGVERVKTGMSGVDSLIEGGIPKGAVALVSGGCGSGKTIFGLQFLVNGAEQGEPGVYISFEEESESIRETAHGFGWNIEELEKRRKLAIMFKDPYEVKDFSESLSGELYYMLKDLNAKRVVIDSITYFGTTVKDEHEVRKNIAVLTRRLKSMGCTTLLVSEVPEGDSGVGRFGMEEFIADGVINLHNFLIKDMRQRAIEVLKMRKTDHDTFLHPFKITRKGIVVYPDEQVFK